MSDDALERLIADIERADSIAAVQSAVLLGNDYLESTASGEPAVQADERRLELLTEWLDAIRGRLDEFVEAREIDRYSVTISGSVTGPSVSITVTNALESDRK